MGTRSAQISSCSQRLSSSMQLSSGTVISPLVPRASGLPCGVDQRSTCGNKHYWNEDPVNGEQ
jgi:hypothetical protein